MIMQMMIAIMERNLPISTVLILVEEEEAVVEGAGVGEEEAVDAVVLEEEEAAVDHQEIIMEDTAKAKAKTKTPMEVKHCLKMIAKKENRSHVRKQIPI